MPRTKEERYRKYGSDWRVSFTRASQQLCSEPGLVQNLVEHGVSRTKSEQLCRDHPEEEIEQQIDVFEWIMEHEPESLKNPAGYLAESIRQSFQPPSRYQTKEQRAAANQLRSDRQRIQSEQLRTEREQRERLANEREHVKSVRESLTAAELKKLEAQALSKADETQRQALASLQSRELQLTLLVDEQILRQHPIQASNGKN